MQRHVQFVHRTVSLVDYLIDGALVVESPRIESPTTTVEKVQHRPDSVAERFGLLGGKARALHT
jgi:hypothetical protein